MYNNYADHALKLQTNEFLFVKPSDLYVHKMRHISTWAYSVTHLTIYAAPVGLSIVYNYSINHNLYTFELTAIIIVYLINCKICY